MSNEKKKLHASTILISLSIVILIAVAVFLGYSYYKEKQHAANLQEEVRIYTDKANTLESDVLTTKQELEAVKNQEDKKPDSEVVKNVYFDPKLSKVKMPNCEYSLGSNTEGDLSLQILNDSSVEFLSFHDNGVYVSEGVVSDISNIKVEKSIARILQGFNSKPIDCTIAWYGHNLNNVFMVFLMNDGTCEYLGIKDAITNGNSQGKIPEVKNIVKIEKATLRYPEGGGQGTIIGIDNNNNFYDLGYLIQKSGYKLK